MRESHTISVVICTHSHARFARLEQTIDSVLGQSTKAHEIILVVDGDQALLEQAKSAFPAIRIIANTRTKGLSGARNTGVLSSSGQIVAFLDDDAVASDNWLAEIDEAFDAQKTFGVGGPIVPSWPDKRPRWLPGEFDWVVGCSYAGQAIEPGTIRNLIGCNMAFRRGALLMAGLFGEGLGRVGANAAGAEETEFCIRAGAMFPMSELAYSQRAGVLHQIDANRDKLGYFVRRCIAEGRSKASIVGMRKGGAKLSSERKHLTSVLPKALFGYLADRVRGRDRYGLERVGALVLGSALVVGSFLLARLLSKRSTGIEMPFAPLRVCDIDLAAPEAIAATNLETGVTYGAAHCVVRNHGKLVVVTQLPLYGEDLTAKQVVSFFSEARIDAPHANANATVPVRVVVATRDRGQMLARCLDSLLKQDYPTFDIVVVDNAPSDTATRDLVKTYYEPTGKVRYLVEPRPGLANAHNRGLEALDSDIVAFTDDDVIADPKWLRSLVQPFVDDPQVGCVTGGIVPAELETRAQCWTERHGAFLKGLERRNFDLHENRPASPLFPFAAGQLGSGANMAFSRAAILAIGGGFDPALGAGTLTRGGDDLAAFADVVLAGFRLSYVPDALVWHFHRRQQDGMKRQAYGYGMGLGAYLTKCVIDRPTRLLTFAKALPFAAKHFLGKSSEKNARLPSDYPAAFVWSERLGLLAGVSAYLKSRRLASRAVDDASLPPIAPAPVWKGF